MISRTEEDEGARGNVVTWKPNMADEIQYSQELLDFLNTKWIELQEVRDQTKSVQEAQDQQENLVGSRDILDRLTVHLAKVKEDPFFLKEQLHLFRWRV